MTQQTQIKLQDLLTKGDAKNGVPSTAFEKVKQQVSVEFAQTESDVAAFFGKIFPQAIDVMCAINKSVSRRNRTLLYCGNEVPGLVLTPENCLDVCKQALTAFPNTMNAMVTAIKNRVSAAYITELSEKFCREFNTLSAFQASASALKTERIARACVPQDKPAASDENFSELITIPVGMSGTREVSVGLNVTGPDAHAVVSGMSGSGKSSLLQTLILSGAYKYSPDKLQFWILDFKDGTGLIQFKALKHVKMMSVKNRAVDANEIMDCIKNEYSRRTELISSSGGGDICEYNRRAEAEGKPLMPRLLIIIDEFVIMHRSCFAVLNEIAVVGRSMGMGFVLSSQIIETGAAYGNAVQQANHLFEFKNSDSSFGRLVKNVTDDEKKFACAGAIGSCIYRRNDDRTKLRIAYAGGVDEQTEFIRKINDKWNSFPYREPIIAGRPERKLCDAFTLKIDVEQLRDTYKRMKKVFVPIGCSRMGEPYMYKVDRDNQLLVMFGDETRAASVEFSVIEHFKAFAELEKSVYYVDLNCNPDREENAVTARYDSRSADICYADTDNGANIVIDKVYKILQARRKLARTDRSKDIGSPIELIIHNAERISELDDKKRAPKIGGITRGGSNISDIGDDLDAFLSSVPKAADVIEENDIDTFEKLKEIIDGGKNSRIFVMLYFEERNRFQTLANDLFTYNYDFKDVLVVPRIPDEYEELSYSEITDSLAACRLREQAAIFEQNKLVQSNFICAVLIDDKVPHKIIPYEWK